ncbi:MAG TPA: F0F1 ATP synthase subunit delta [Candidatus Saccharimonadales bacterium]|jgi:F0F1-type ATP synthase delta subunit
MKTPRHTIARALAKQSLTVSDFDSFSSEIAAYLLSERRVGELDSIMRDIMQYRADHGIVEVSTIGAYELDDAVRADITNEVQALYPDAEQVIISHRIDTSVVGGVRLEFANQQLDLSVRNKLNRLKQLTAHP